MIAIDKVLTPEHTFCDLEVESNKRLLEIIAVYMNEAVKTIPTQTIYEALIERERLGSTAIGSGVALPHARIEGIDSPIAVFMRLKNGIDFNADDDQPVDLVFALIVPKNADKQYLNILSQLAHRFRDPTLLSRLRHCESPNALHQCLISQQNKQTGQFQARRHGHL